MEVRSQGFRDLFAEEGPERPARDATNDFAQQEAVRERVIAARGSRLPPRLLRGHRRGIGRRGGVGEVHLSGCEIGARRIERGLRVDERRLGGLELHDRVFEIVLRGRENGLGFGEARRSPYLQTHGAFHFLLDYVPRWQWMTKPGGLVQFQPFLPKDVAPRVLRQLIELCQQKGHVPYLGVLKKHRPDPFLMTHAVDGYSMAMDICVSRNRARREALWRHCQEMAEIVLEAGGRFYYAKDAMLLASSFPRVHGEDAVAQFRALKQRWDPDGLFQTDLSRRMGV